MAFIYFPLLENGENTGRMTPRCLGFVLLLLLVFNVALCSISSSASSIDILSAQTSISSSSDLKSTSDLPQDDLDGKGVHTPPHHSLFSTHSTNPWSRTRRRWGLWQITTKANASSTLRRTTIHLSDSESFGVDSNKEVHESIHSERDVHSSGNTEGHMRNGAADEEVVEAWPCPGNATLFSPFRYLLQECRDNKTQFARIILTIAWLMVLFYLLGSTASDYFSGTLEKLSETLKLSPAVAGVTLLAVGNGAPDVFSSVAAFISSDKAGGIGFSCVLGGALFITTVVSGIVAFVTAERGRNNTSSQKINFLCFVRDALFLLASSAALIAILFDGKVYLWEAALFLSLYALYAIFVWAAEVFENRIKDTALIEDSLVSPKAMMESLLPQRITPLSDLHHHHHQYRLYSHAFEAELEYFFESEKDNPVAAKSERLLLMLFKCGIEWPLALPRRLTIPVIEEERWSRPYAIASCTLAPIFVGGVCIVQGNVSGELAHIILATSVCAGIGMGALAFKNTENAKPPCRFLWLWLGGGFLMSVVWFYLVADQVVASLETLGDIFSINPAILGLTVLAWGNSIGDLVADLALACGSRDGVQIAISGCYAGPLFNIIVGLGLSLVIACWRSDPSPLIITDEDGTLFFIIGFLAAGLIWSLVMIPLNKMRLSKSFGAGLLLLYCSFLIVGGCYTMGWISR